MNLKEENEKLTKDNAAIIASINVSKLALEEAVKQEKEAKAAVVAVIAERARMSDQAKVLQSEILKLNTEIGELVTEKSDIINDIALAKKQASSAFENAKNDCNSEIDSLKSVIESKNIELSEINKNIISRESVLEKVKSEHQSILDEIKKAKDILAKIISECEVKDEQFDNITGEINALNKVLEKAKQVLKDTQISTEAYEDKKSVLITELVGLEEAITANKVEITSLNTEIINLEARKEAKEAEYKAAESKIFDLLRREEAVTERENYAIERFKTAGLEY